MATKKAKRRNKLSKKPSLRDVPVKVDASLKAAWDAVAKRLDAAEHEGAKAYDELWEAAGEAVAHDPPLYVLGGYKTAAEFFEQRLHTDKRTAERNVRVAKYATPEDEERYGSTNLDAAIRWLEAKHGPLGARLPVAFDKLKIVVGGKPVAFEKLTAAQIDAATRALGKKGGTPAHRARTAFEEALGKHDVFKETRVNEHAGRVTFTRVPLGAIGLFARTIAAVKVPEPAS
ncbi:MAG TPA: hypothetical protein VLM85_09455 [Polyangiaceae bacterium]|nr:hypothetical protein [Polyangiaceae bacterium]